MKSSSGSDRLVVVLLVAAGAILWRSSEYERRARRGRARPRDAEVRGCGGGRGAAGRPAGRPACRRRAHRGRRKGARADGGLLARRLRRGDREPRREAAGRQRAVSQDARARRHPGRPSSAGWIRSSSSYAEILRENPSNAEAAFNYEYVGAPARGVRGAQAAGAAARCARAPG